MTAPAPSAEPDAGAGRRPADGAAARVRVVPEEFRLVLFDASRIAELVAEVAAAVGVDRPVAVEVDEGSVQGWARLTGLDPVTLSVAGGAFEDARRPRHLSEANVREVAGRMLLRARDRLDPAFGDPPAEEELTQAQSVAWTAYCLGRLERLGYPPSRPRWLYHFRNRHGFTDVADAAFDRLWAADGLAWADIAAACEATEAARTPAPG